MTRIQPKGGFTKSSCGANDGSRQGQTWKGGTWDTFPIIQNQQGGFQRNFVFPHFDHFRVWEIQLRTLGRRKGDFSGERPNIDRSSNVWPGLIMPKGQVCRTHATPDLIPLPRSTFLRVSTKIQLKSHIYALIRKKIQNKKLFLDAKQTKSTQALNILDSRPVWPLQRQRMGLRPILCLFSHVSLLHAFQIRQTRASTFEPLIMLKQVLFML